MSRLQKPFNQKLAPNKSEGLSRYNKVVDDPAFPEIQYNFLPILQ